MKYRSVGILAKIPTSFSWNYFFTQFLSYLLFHFIVSFLVKRRNPVYVQGNITFSSPHILSHHDDVSDTESTDITEVLPVGYQVTSLLGTLLWISVGQDSHLPIQPVLHGRGEYLNFRVLQKRRSGTENPRLLPQTSLYEWDHECVVGVEPMCVWCHGTYTSTTSVLQVGGSLWVVTFGVLELGVTLVHLSDRNLEPVVPFQTPVVMTQEGGCVYCVEQGC